VHPTGYGRILRNENGDINGVVEENDASPTQKQINEVNPGIYAFDAEFLHDALSGLKSHNAKNEYYLTDVIAMAGSSVVGMHVPASETLGINDREQLAEAEQILRRRILSKWMKAGVTCMDPASTYIDNDVQVGQDVLLGPGVMLLGKTKVGNNVSIGAGSILTHTTVDDHARIHPYSVCDEAHIGTKAEVGPFARLRPLARLDESTKIGNFVEVKKSHFKKGSKANHLAYVGDTDVGENCNIGAGTITCNYNGFGKHKTTLEDGVFIGSNCTLVAPLVVGEQAYVAAGSTVTKDVPSNALAISRGRQENKEGYAARIRARLKK
jgi:bifunctional UDP-N-acetylglucosamine pyrophosphorylase/glucosamine-1-phosphate N-acetyltransferase